MHAACSGSTPIPAFVDQFASLVSGTAGVERLCDKFFSTELHYISFTDDFFLALNSHPSHLTSLGLVTTVR